MCSIGGKRRERETKRVKHGEREADKDGEVGSVRNNKIGGH